MLFVIFCFKDLLKRLLHFILFDARPLKNITAAAKNRYRKPPTLKTLKRQFIIIFSYLIFTYVRLVFWGIALKNEENCNFKLVKTLQQWDPLYYTAKVNFGLVSSVIVFGLSFEMLFAVYLQYLVELKVHQIYASFLMADMYIFNVDDFMELNSAILFNGVSSPFSLSSLKQLYFNLNHIWFKKETLLKLKHPILAHYPGITKQIRVQAALIATAAELLDVTLIMPCIGKNLSF